MLHTDHKIGQRVAVTHRGTGETYTIKILDIFLDANGDAVARLGHDDPDWLFLIARPEWRGRPEGSDPHPARIITKGAPDA